MDSFDEVGTAPELVEALAAEGIERPTPLQVAAVPVVRKGNNVVLAAGPGSGLLVAWAAGLLDRIEAEGNGPRLLVLTATRETAEALAEAVARLTVVTGHTVAALGSSWVLPERAQVLFGTPGDVLGGTSSGLSLADVEALVIDQAQLIESFASLSQVEQVLDYLDSDTQRVLSALPLSEGAADLVERHLKRAVTVPPPDSADSPDRGEIRFRITPEPRESATLSIVAELLSDEARHVLVFCRGEDRAADVGDYLTLHGYVAGAPGDESVPVWLGVDALDARDAVEGVEGVVVVSCDAPADPDSLDRRHSISPNGVVVALPREVAHLKSLGKRTGYDTVPFPPPARGADSVAQLRDTIRGALDEQDLAPYLLALEPLFEEHDPAEVAAAAVALLREKGSAVAVTTDSPRAAAPTGPAPTPAWAKLFVSVGERDGLRPGDLLGAITGEAGVRGEAVGRIDIKESHSLVEVHDAVARKVIAGINGTTIKGRSVRADFDRPRRGTTRRGAR